MSYFIFLLFRWSEIVERGSKIHLKRVERTTYLWTTRDNRSRQPHLPKQDGGEGAHSTSKKTPHVLLSFGEHEFQYIMKRRRISGARQLVHKWLFARHILIQLYEN